MIAFISDIDNTLGRSTNECKRTIKKLMYLFEPELFCLVTGRGLHALSDLESSFADGLLISPWNGGNVLEWRNQAYRWRLPPKVLDQTNVPGFKWQFINDTGIFTSKSERVHDAQIEYKRGFVCVGAYREITEQQYLNVPTKEAEKSCTINEKKWVLLSGWKVPRACLVNRLRSIWKCPIVYCGDDISDALGGGCAEVFLTPRKSLASAFNPCLKYDSSEELIDLLKALRKQRL